MYKTNMLNFLLFTKMHSPPCPNCTLCTSVVLDKLFSLSCLVRYSTTVMRKASQSKRHSSGWVTNTKYLSFQDFVTLGHTNTKNHQCDATIWKCGVWECSINSKKMKEKYSNMIAQLQNSLEQISETLRLHFKMGLSVPKPLLLPMPENSRSSATYSTISLVHLRKINSRLYKTQLTTTFFSTLLLAHLSQRQNS